VRAELTPEPTGALRELTASMDTGDLAAVLALPGWMDAAVFTRSLPTETPALAARVESVLGERLKGADRERLRAFLGDVDRGLGRARAAGFFDAGGLGLFAVGTGGDSAALGRAMQSLPTVAKIAAIQGPLDAIAGRATFIRDPLGPGGAGRWAVRFTKPGQRAPSDSFHVAASSSGDRAGLVVERDEPGPRLAELLEHSGVATVGADPAVMRAVTRAGDGAHGAALIRIRTESASTHFAMLAFGSDRKMTWAEVVMGEAVFHAVARASIGP
jgi:hypothetical protein